MPPPIHPILLDTIKAISRVANRDELCQHMVENGRRYSGASMVTLSFARPEQQMLVTEFAAGHDAHPMNAALRALKLNPIGLHLPLSADWVRQMLHEHRPVVIRNLHRVLFNQLSPPLAVALARATRFRQYVGTPLIASGRVVGQVGYFFAAADPQRDLGFLETYAEVAAVVIKNLQDLTALQSTIIELRQKEILTSTRPPAAPMETVADRPVGPAPSPAVHILLVEDNPVNQKMTLLVLERRGWKTSLARNGQEAVEMAAQQPFDLVLMDVQMPVMDGITAAQQIRHGETDSGRYTPIIAMTAHATRSDKVRSLAAGMDAHLTKPIRPQKVYQVIDRFLDLPLPAQSLQMLLDTLGGDRELLKEIVQLFLEHYPIVLQRLSAAVAQQDAPTVMASAHTLKGELAQMGFERALEPTRQLEQMGRDERLGLAPDALSELKIEMARYSAALRRSELFH